MENGEEMIAKWDKWIAEHSTIPGSTSILVEDKMAAAFFAGIDAAEEIWRDGMKELVADTEAKILRRGK